MSDDGRKAIRWTGVAALFAVAVGAVAVAVGDEVAEPAKPAVATPATTQRQRQGGHGDAMAATTRPWKAMRAGDDAAPGARMRGPTDEEWREVAEFMSQYSPNRLKAIEDQGGADRPRFASLRKFVWMHYRDLMAVKEKGDQELYELKLKVAQSEDEVFGLQQQMREAPEPERPVLRHQLRQKIADMVRLGLKERELRIARLEKALADEKEKLAADQQSIDQRVTERLQSMSKGMRDRRRDEPTTTSPAVGSQVK